MTASLHERPVSRTPLSQFLFRFRYYVINRVFVLKKNGLQYLANIEVAIILKDQIQIISIPRVYFIS
jgi:hypothetical protein